MEFFKVDHEIREIDIQAFDYPDKKIRVIAYIENEAGEILVEQKNTVSIEEERLFECVGTEVLRSDINYRFAINRIIKDTYGKKSGIQVKDTVGIAHVYKDQTDYVYIVYNGKYSGEELAIQDYTKALSFKFMKSDELINSDTIESISKYVVKKISNLEDVGKIEKMEPEYNEGVSSFIKKFLGKKNKY